MSSRHPGAGIGPDRAREKSDTKYKLILERVKRSVIYRTVQTP